MGCVKSIKEKIQEKRDKNGQLVCNIFDYVLTESTLKEKISDYDINEKYKRTYTINSSNLEGSHKPFSRKLSRKLSIHTLQIKSNFFVYLKNKKLSNYYRQDGIIGIGSFGKVFKVTHKITSFYNLSILLLTPIDLVRAMKVVNKKKCGVVKQHGLFNEVQILK